MALGQHGYNSQIPRREQHLLLRLPDPSSPWPRCGSPRRSPGRCLRPAPADSRRNHRWERKPGYGCDWAPDLSPLSRLPGPSGTESVLFSLGCLFFLSLRLDRGRGWREGDTHKERGGERRRGGGESEIRRVPQVFKITKVWK